MKVENRIIKFYGRCSEDAAMILYINGTIVFAGEIKPVKVNDDFDQYIIAEIENVLDFYTHVYNIKIVCIRGNISVNTVDTNFCQEINTALSLEDRRTVQNDMQAGIAQTVPEPFSYYKNLTRDGDGLLTRLEGSDDRTNIKVNGLTPMDGGNGWFYYLEQKQNITYDFSVYRPYDLLAFIIDHNLGQEYFDKE